MSKVIGCVKSRSGGWERAIRRGAPLKWTEIQHIVSVAIRQKFSIEQIRRWAVLPNDCGIVLAFIPGEAFRKIEDSKENASSIAWKIAKAVTPRHWRFTKLRWLVASQDVNKARKFFAKHKAELDRRGVTNTGGMYRGVWFLELRFWPIETSPNYTSDANEAFWSPIWPIGNWELGITDTKESVWSDFISGKKPEEVRREYKKLPVSVRLEVADFLRKSHPDIYKRLVLPDLLGVKPA